MRNDLLVAYLSAVTAPKKKKDAIGAAGMGVFGYTLSPDGKKRSQNYPAKTDWKFGREGIVRKKEWVVNEDSCINVLDIIAYKHSDKANNNTCELEGILQILNLALNSENIKDVSVICTNDYMEKCYTYGLPMWEKSDWKAKNGHTIRNKDMWIKLTHLLGKAKEMGVTFTIKTIVPPKVKGVIEYCPGHAISNLYAIMGITFCNEFISRASNELPPDNCYNQITDIKDYIAQLTDRDIIFDYKNVIAHTNDKNDEDMLFLASPPKEVDDIGKRMLGNSYALVVGDVPDYINNVKAFFRGVRRLYHVTFKVNLNVIKSNKPLFRLFKMIDFRNLVTFGQIEDIDYFYLDSEENRFIESMNRYYPFLLEVKQTREACIRVAKHLEDFRGKPELIDLTHHFITDGKFTFDSKLKNLDITPYVNLPRHKFVSKPLLWLNKELPLRTTMKNVFEMSDDFKCSVFIDTVRNNNLASIFFIMEYTVEGKKALMVHIGILDRFLIEYIN